MLFSVRKFFILALAALPVALADSLSYWEQQGIININFDEPVVPYTAVENQHRDDCSVADKGLDLFSISGDEAHPPRVRWVDQDCLRIEPGPGSSVKTEYTLRFHAGTRYQSGRPLPQREYRFHAPASPLVHEDMRACPNGAALLAARFQNTEEAAGLSPQTPIHYTYTRLKMDDRGDFFESGETAGAIVEQAQLRHGNSFNMLQSLVRRGIKWQELQQDSPLPGYVLVRPDRPVPAGSIWRLNAKAAPGSGIADSNLGPIYVNRSLSARLEQVLPEGAGSPELQMLFNSPVEKAHLQQAFREMKLTLDGVETVLAEDGLTRTAVVNGRELRVRYLGEVPAQQFWINPDDPEDESVTDGWLEDKAKRRVRYAHPTASMGMRLSVESPVPVLVESTLKAGLAGIYGLPLEQEFACRYSVSPLEPGLPREVRYHLPLQGAHKLPVSVVNGSTLRVRLRHWPADAVRAALPKIYSHLEQQNRRHGMALTQYERALVQARIKAGLATEDGMPPAPDNAVRAREVYLGRLFLEGAGGTVLGQREIQLPTGDCPMMADTRVELDFDEICGGTPRPGLYLVEMDMLPSETVMAAARELGMQPGDWELRCDALVSVSDLSPLELRSHTSGESGLLVLRHSTAEPLHGGQMLALKDDGGVISAPVENGYVALPSGVSDILVRAGDDYCLVANPNEFSDAPEKEQEGDAELRAMVWTDREIYRPGDKVFVRGFLRAVDGLNRIAHSKHRTLELHFESPSGARLFSRVFDVDAYGAFQQELTLPKGQDDVCGPYVVRVGTTRPRTLVRKTIACEVYRRDSFELSVHDETEKIAPGELVLRVKAQDYNKLPLTEGRAELRVLSPVALQGARQVAASGYMAYEWRGSLPLKEDGTALFTLPLAATPESDFMVEYEGAVLNEREEARRFEDAALLCAADVRPELGDDYTLRLLCNCCDKPYSQGLSVRVAVKAPRRVETQLPNGFMLDETRQVEAWSRWVNVPADSADGVQLPLQEVLAGLQLDDEEEYTIEISGRDYRGRVFRHARSYYKTPTRGVLFSAASSAKPGHIILECSEDFKALLVLSYGRRVRTHVLDLQRGKHELLLPLLGDEEGRINVCAARLTQRPGSGLFDYSFVHSLGIDVPVKRSMLQVQLELPGTVRPGTPQQLSGRVTLPNGVPTCAAVTLYAVDAGVLSQTPFKRVDVVAALSRWREKVLYVRSLLPSGVDDAGGVFRAPFSLLDGLWQGEGRSAGGSWQHQPWWMRVGTTLGAVDQLLDSTQSDATPCTYYRAAHAAGMGVRDATGELPYLRQNFAPLALWRSALQTNADGRFSTVCTLPDTLTTYRVFAVAADREGSRFGSAEGEFVVNQPLILRAGTPLCMCAGDKLQVPVAVTNNTQAEGSWEIGMEGSPARQTITLAAGATATLFFELAPQQAGRQAFRWVAVGATGADAVQSEVDVVYPSPLLKEVHHLVLAPGQGNLVPRQLLSAELAGAPDVELNLQVSANPLLFMQGAVDYLLQQPGGNVANMASSLLPWLLYDRFAPLCPRMAQVPAGRVPQTIENTIQTLLKLQLPCGGLPTNRGSNMPSLWASAQAAVVIRLAEERGYAIPQREWYNLLAYLEKADISQEHPLTRYQVARALQDRALMRDALQAALAAAPDTRWCTTGVRQDIEFLEYLRTNNDGRREAFLRWLRTRAADYRHSGAWSGGWSIYALLTYIGNSPGASVESALRLPGGQQLALRRDVVGVPLPTVDAACAPVQGETYAVLRAQARPARQEYPGLTERGLQITRLYEKKGEDGIWREATSFAVGDIVRVSLTCAKASEQELNHLVLEDYLPANMEAINPGVGSQSAGLEPLSWSECLDQREYLADRVRGFCTRWPGRDAVNLRYYARVKRAGSATAPPAQAQLQYEPQTYGLSPSTRVESQP